MATEAPAKQRFVVDDSSDSEDERPLAARAPAAAPPAAAPALVPASANGMNGGSSAHAAPKSAPAAKPESDGSEDDVPLAARKPVAPVPLPKKSAALDDAEELPTAPPRLKPVVKPVVAKENDDSDSDDDIPLAQRRPTSGASGKYYFFNHCSSSCHPPRFL